MVGSEAPGVHSSISISLSERAEEGAAVLVEVRRTPPNEEVTDSAAALALGDSGSAKRSAVRLDHRCRLRQRSGSLTPRTLSGLTLRRVLGAVHNQTPHKNNAEAIVVVVYRERAAMPRGATVQTAPYAVQR